MNGSENAPVAAPDESSSGLSLKGLYQVFFSPSEFFARLKDDPKVLVPYLAYFVIVAVFMLLAVDLLVKMTIESPQMQERLQGQPFPEQAKGMMRISTLIFGTVALMLVPLITSGLAIFWGNFVFAGKARFKQILSVMLYGEFLWFIGSLIVLPLALAKGTMLVSLSLAAFLPNPDPTSWVYLILSKLHVFLVWEIIVVGIGLSTVYGMPRNKGYLIAVLSVGLAAALHVLSTLVGGGLQVG